MYTVGSESDSPNDDPKTVTGSPPAGLLACGSTCRGTRRVRLVRGEGRGVST